MMEVEYLEYLQNQQDKIPKSKRAELQRTSGPIILLLDSSNDMLDGEEELLDFAMERTQLSKNELLAAAAFGGVVAVGNDGGSDSSRTDYVEKLALAEETLETKAEEAAQQALTRYREQSGHEYAFLIFEVDGVALPRVELELFHGVCPKTCKNFLALCEHKVPDLSDETQQLGYQGNQVHRVVRGGWIQAGDVAGNGRGDGPCRSLYGLEFPDESFAVSHNAAGILSMANTGPHTNGSQFFITLAPQPWLDRRKVAFGRVVSGWRTVMTIGGLETRQERPCVPCTIVDSGRLQ
ncbi:Peptidyl-prolyl cis-trans isomerase [Phytophthora nicotianae]|nr:Peptidyl-prolyl cis-trans isomerase [Phytophthora nicotianae]